MNKLWLIIKREYLSRVKTKSFILTTLLGPLMLGLFIVIVGFIFSYQGDNTREIVILDEANMLDRKLKDTETFFFRFSEQNYEDVVAQKESKPFDAILVIPALREVESRKLTIDYHSEDQLDLDGIVALQGIVRDKIRDFKIRELALDAEQLENLRTSITINPEPLDPNEEEKAGGATPITSIVGAIIGGFMGFIMYMMVFMNGMMVMRSVMEEKMNRIVEVMISSVKPFTLMMGKIIGVGGVGLTQILVWAILMPLIVFGANMIFGFDTSQAMDLSDASAELNTEDLEVMVGQVTAELKAVNWWLIVPCFILFFLGGFIIYSSLFAAVGSAIGDDLAESQALTLPITIPVILALYIMIAALRSPDSSMAVWSSIFPLFSPIVMPARLAFNPPAWQILLSLALLIATAWGAVWVSARIYRTGILMYGKKGSFKEIWKWMTAKQ